MKKLTYVVLVWNEVKTIRRAINDVKNIKFPNKEIIVIDNASTDGTKEILKTIKNVKIIYRKKNLGAGKSTITGIKKAKGEYVFIQFSDLEYDHFRSLDMMNYAVKNNLDVVLGSRLLQENIIKKSLFQKIKIKPSYIATIVCTYLINKLYDKNFTDIIGGKLYKKSSVIKIPINSFSYGFDFEFISRIIKSELKVGEISINYKPRANSSEKKIKPYHMINALYEIFKVKFFN